MDNTSSCSFIQQRNVETPIITLAVVTEISKFCLVQSLTSCAEEKNDESDDKDRLLFHDFIISNGAEAILADTKFFKILRANSRHLKLKCLELTRSEIFNGVPSSKR